MNLTSLPRWKRNGIFLILLVGVPSTLLIAISNPDLSDEMVLVQRIADLKERMLHAQMLNRARHEDVLILSQSFTNLLASAQRGASADLLMDHDAQKLLRNMTHKVELMVPTVYGFMPHLLQNPDSLRPAYRKSQGRSGVSVVLGIPTVKREVQSYLLNTLHNLIESMSVEEQDDCLIVVFVAETDLEYVQQVGSQIERQYPAHLESGLIEVVSPPESYYPDMARLKQTLGDPMERVQWRTKQNLDFAFLMMYCQPKGTFYVQLEDDILTKRGFITTMKRFALQRTAKKEDWFVLDFCQLGFIGKLFKCAELGWLVQFFLMFYNDKPVDWLLDNLIQTRACRLDRDSKACRKAKDKLWVQYKPSLFQHIGTHSSLKGKVQKLKDKQFGKVPLFFPHKNPPAAVETAIKAYKSYSLNRAYKGETFFWGLLPQKDDHMSFSFNPPVPLKRYLFRSGNVEHPSDRLYDTSVEMLPDSPLERYIGNAAYNVTPDGYVVAGEFDELGVAEGYVNPALGPIRCIRLHVRGETEHWVILSEIYIEKGDSR